MSRIFLTKQFEEGSTKYFAIDSDKIETLNLFATYDRNGQKVGHYDAGDYCLDNSASDAPKECKKAIHDKFGVDIYEIHFVSEGDTFEIEAGDGDEYGFNESDVNAFIKEWQKENESLIEVKGFTYWNGHNWKTITISVDFGEPSHLIVDDETLIAELNKAIDEKEFEGEGFGCKVYKGNGYVVVDSQWQGTWAEYEIVSEQDYEFEQEANSSTDYRN